MNCGQRSVIRPSAKTPMVWVTVTVRPSSTACRGVPRVPTRYAATIVLPWPGLSACAAPQNIASSSASATTPALRSSCAISAAKPLSPPDGRRRAVELAARRAAPAARRDRSRATTRRRRSSRRAGSQQVLRVRAQLVAHAAGRRRASRTLRAGVRAGRRSPSSRRPGEVRRRGSRAVRLPGRGAAPRTRPRTASCAARRPRREGERVPERARGHGTPVDPQRRCPRSIRRRRSVAPRSARSRLEGRDLGQVEHVEHVDAVARGVDAAVAVDR